MAAKKVKKKVVKKRVAKKKVAIRKKVAAKKKVIKRRAVKKKVAKKRFIKKKVMVKKKVGQKRKQNPIIPFYIIKIVKGTKVFFFDGSQQGASTIWQAAHYQSKPRAKRIAQEVADFFKDTAQVFVKETALKKT